ncbi:MAG: ATP-binding cassette domain-containing protein [Bacteroidales bacterium]|nr:ATP-binding cassette domain-containing protein [Bacteroidales bacterium]
MFLDNLIDKYNVNKKAVSTGLDTLRSMLGGDGNLGLSTGSASSALDAVFSFYDIDYIEREKELDGIKDIKDFLSTRGFLFNEIQLSGKWWKKTCGAIIARTLDGKILPLLPDTFGYHTIDPETRKEIKISSSSSKSFTKDAICFFRPLGRKKLTKKDFYRYCRKIIPKRDYVAIISFCVAATLLNMLFPVASRILFRDVIPSGMVSGILPICAFLLASGVSAVLFNLCNNFMLVRVKDKFNAEVQPSLMARLLYLPTNFFRKQSAGGLGQRVLAANSVYHLITCQILEECASFIFAGMYILIAFFFAKEMIWLVTATLIAAIILSYFKTKNYSKEYSDKIPRALSAQEFTYSALSGIQKIKNNRAEFRVFSKWTSAYCSSEIVLKHYKMYGVVLVTVSTFFAYLTAWKTGIALSDYIAFMSAFGMMQVAFDHGMIAQQTIVNIRPYVDLLEPILSTEPEVNAKMPFVNDISGSIDVNHVSFHYQESPALVLDDVSLHIKAGENIGLVGSSGCGKSTLLRLMLGFDKATSGSIFYGQYNVNNINLSSLRQFIGLCPQAMQIFPGTIAENIMFSVSSCTEEDLWNAARIACIDEDIRKMPEGMGTILGEGGSGLSGGQCQRILIARAVINKPKILFMDEATSALDNITQKQVIKNLGEFGCTRVSIAHRLSTLMTCDRIFCLDKGKIIEEGSPEELLARKGFFYQLTIRQQ